MNPLDEDFLPNDNNENRKAYTYLTVAFIVSICVVLSGFDRLIHMSNYDILGLLFVSGPILLWLYAIKKIRGHRGKITLFLFALIVCIFMQLYAIHAEWFTI